MTLLAPLGGFFGLTLVAILLLYILRIRRSETPLSSTLLWRRAVQDRQASVPWQRLRPSRLLLLQLLAAALLVGALMRPAVAGGASLGGHTIVVIDVSASMQATDVAPSRFEVARSRVAQLVERLGSGDRLTLISLGPAPRVVADVRGDRGAVRVALAALHPLNGGADLQGALALATASAGDGRDAHLYVFSDGRTQPLRAPLTLPFAVDYAPVGVSGEDLAITGIGVTPGPGPRTTVVHVQNLGRQHRHTSVEYRVDSVLSDARPLDLDAGTGRDLSFDLPATARAVSATLTPHDLLALDDVAVAVARQPRTFRVRLVTDHNLFLLNALRLRADLAVTTVAARDWKPDRSVDLDIFDGVVPPNPPDHAAWYLAPPQSTVLGTGALISPGRPRLAAIGDPLVDGIDLTDVHIARARSLQGSTFGRSLVDGELGPLVMVRDAEPRAVLFGFDIHDSDLPLRTAFPLLVDRLSAYLLPEAVPPAPREPDDAIDVNATNGATSVRVTSPSGATTVLSGAGGVLAGSATDELGLYTVEIVGPGGADRTQVAVDALDLGRSSIAPLTRLDLSGSAAGPVPAGRSPDTELWPWLVAAALLVLLAEWLVYHRG